jgi:hypothetical protein
MQVCINACVCVCIGTCVYTCIGFDNTDTDTPPQCHMCTDSYVLYVYNSVCFGAKPTLTHRQDSVSYLHRHRHDVLYRPQRLDIAYVKLILIIN